jgi:nitrite reductase (NADH) large subunit
MEQLVDAYECEWKQIVEDEQLQGRFKHFINSEESDDNLVFVPMREQKMPKAW